MSSDKKPREREKLTYLHRKVFTELKNGKSVTTEEMVKNGPSGVSFKYYQKIDSKSMKVTGFQRDGKFVLRVTKDKKQEPEVTGLSKDAIVKELKKMKNLEFAVKYLTSAVKSGGAWMCRPRRRQSRSRGRSRSRSRSRTKKKTKSKPKRKSTKKKKPRRSSSR